MVSFSEKGNTGTESSNVLKKKKTANTPKASWVIPGIEEYANIKKCINVIHCPNILYHLILS